MERLNIRRGAEKRKLTNFTKWINEYVKLADGGKEVPVTQQIELSTRLQTALRLKNDFEVLQDEIEGISEKLEEEFAYRDEFMDTYYSTISIAKGLLRSASSASAAESPESSASRSSSNISGASSDTQFIRNSIKLPTISLPTFDGESSLAWTEFRDLYISLIHENPNLTPVQKFHYLRASLKGSSAQVIKSLDFTSDNYEIAWAAICERFNDKRLLVHNHIKAIFSIEPMNKESPSKLRNINDSLFKHVSILRSLIGEEEMTQSILLYIITSKIDGITLREWEMDTKYNHKESPSLSDFMEFSKTKANRLETIEAKQSKSFDRPKGNVKTLVSVESTSDCPLCKGQHILQQCQTFNGLTPSERSTKARELRVCINCLRKGHFADRCKSKFRCRQCKQSHHTLLHFITSTSEGSHANANLTAGNSTFSAVSSNSTKVLLPTVSVGIHDSTGRVHRVRALLDSGSQSHFITSRLCRKLNLSTRGTTIHVSGISDCTSAIKSSCDVEIHSNYSNFKLKVACLVIDHITGHLPGLFLDTTHLNIPSNIRLSDPSFGIPAPVDILLGASVFWDLLCTGRISLGPQQPILSKTRFGWIVSGPLGPANTSQTKCHLVQVQDVQEQLSKFWELEQFPAKRLPTESERLCEQHFVETTKRGPDGRFVVKIPLDKSPQLLGDSFNIAKRRLLSLETRLMGNEKLRKMYIEFMQEYIKLDHMSLVKRGSEIACYLPHHGVLKKESITTKLRVVFNGSAVTSSGYSLNSIQRVGPTIQSDLVTILIRFRQHRYAISADITKMYRQVEVNPEQRALQRILWRFSPEEPIESYELNTVTYGTASASFLAIRALTQLASDFEKSHPELSKVIREDFYVDDLLTGSDDIATAQIMCKGLQDILASGCFPIRKWISNDSSVLDLIDPSHKHPYLLEFGSHESTKTLGLGWCFHTDSFRYSISESPHRSTTKRTILSEISQIFDPMGLLSPCTILVKAMLQQLWLEKLSWDESVSNSLQEKWLSFRKDLLLLNKLEIPRHCLISEHKHIEIHGFSDASNLGYGGCVYVKSTNAVGEVKISLLCSKARVAPLKPMTIPCLELCGAVVLARLVSQISKSLRLSIARVVCWTDSTIVLGWLKMHPSRLKIFVCNRVVEIQDLVPQGTWKHVPTASNPADLLSRGTSPANIINSTQWWQGPQWLQQDPCNWPADVTTPENLPHTKKEERVLVTQVNESLFDRFSDLTKLQYVVAYMLRFISNCRESKGKRKIGPLSCAELQDSLLRLSALSQRDSFSEEAKSLHKNHSVQSNSSIMRLHPFVDDNLIRVGGRLANSKYSYTKKHPILISGRHIFAKMMMLREHVRLLHCGPQMLLYTVRERFWVTSGRSLANKCVRTCVKCFKASPKISTPLMGNLPSSRIQPSPPFTLTGVDYAGPIPIKDKRGRGCKLIKSYICLFICFATKAIHLELVTSLDAESFIMALRRFVSRRGKPSRIFSDNGTNFIGANNELRELGSFLSKDNDVSERAAGLGVDWSFIPANSPHFGGLWESGVKSVKHHIKRVSGNSKLTYEELLTLLVQVEAILNSRPLSALSSDPNDLQPLTPAHFLVGRPLTALPDPDVTDIADNRLSVFQRVQQLQQHIWNRWSKEYVSSLQVRAKWSKDKFTLKENSLVLIKDDNLPPLKWKMGRIIGLHPGKDGINRVASIRTATGNLRRAFSKICVLPISDGDESE